MNAPATVADFLALIRRSGLVEPPSLNGYIARLGCASALPQQPNQLAALLVRDGLLTPFQTEQLLQGRWRGFTLGQYKILGRIGSGGMGTVYLGEHRSLRRQVALKVLPADKASDPACLGRFHREAQAVAALNHPHIVRAYDVGVDGNTYFLVMEYVEGTDLQEVVQKQGRLDIGKAVDYTRQVASGLEHAHRAGLVHRDIKPANLLLSHSGVVKILDMGLARFFNEDDPLTREFEHHVVLGTADYLAPEQGRDSHDVDIRADIYSLGATLYFLLTGQPPFAGGTLNQKLLWHQMRNPEPVRVHRPEVPEGLDAVVARMMAKDVADRYQTPWEVVEALAPWAPAGTVLPAPPELAARAARSGQAGSPPPLPPESSAAQTDTTRTEPRTLGTRVSAQAGTSRPAGASAAEAISARPAGFPEQDWGQLVEKTPAGSGSNLVRRRLRPPRWLWVALAVTLVLSVGGWLLLWEEAPEPRIHPRPTAPAAPVNLRATPGEFDEIELRWSHRAARTTRFKIERATDRAFTQNLSVVTVTRPGVTRYVDRTLATGLTYYYRVQATGSTGDSAYSNTAWVLPDYGQGFTTTGLTLNGSAAVTGKALRLTDGQAKWVAGSAFYSARVNVEAFTTTFRFRISPGPTSADGFTFCIQGNDASSLGGPGGDLGYGGITRSLAIKFDLWNNAGEGVNSTGLFTNGAKPDLNGSVNLTGTGIDLHSGRTYLVKLVYKGRRLSLTITDVADPTKVFRRTFPIDIPATVGGPTAYVGFTGSSGGSAAIQDVLNWTFTPAGS